jgi:hypothetical protein
MLRTFIRFSTGSLCNDPECVESSCFNLAPEYETALPAIYQDEIKFIVDKSDANFWDAQHLKVAIADECGNYIQDAGTIEQGGGQYFVTVTVPDLTGPHRIIIYNSVQVNLISITPESSPGACDAIVTFEIPEAPTENFEYSLDGTTFQSSSTFTGVCQELLTVYVRIVGETCTCGEVNIDISPLDCTDYSGWTLQQFQDAGIKLFQLYDCTLDDIKP